MVSHGNPCILGLLVHGTMAPRPLPALVRSSAVADMLLAAVAAGYVHIIDDETQWDGAFGRNIMIGLMGRPAEDMHRAAKADSIGVQQQAVAAFAKQFEPYDWTKQLA